MAAWLNNNILEPVERMGVGQWSSTSVTLPPRGHQHGVTFFIVTTGECYGHLEGSGQGCCSTSYSAHRTVLTAKGDPSPMSPLPRVRNPGVVMYKKT